MTNIRSLMADVHYRWVPLTCWRSRHWRISEQAEHLKKLALHSLSSRLWWRALPEALVWSCKLLPQPSVFQKEWPAVQPRCRWLGCRLSQLIPFMDLRSPSTRLPWIMDEHDDGTCTPNPFALMKVFYKTVNYLAFILIFSQLTKECTPI